MNPRITHLLLCCALFFLTACSKQEAILHGVDEKEANLIVVLLESRGIASSKETTVVSGVGGSENNGPKYNILVDKQQSIQAMAYLNRNGLPRKSGQSLLDIFSKSGLVSSDKEETIRYQSGLAAQLSGMIEMMDGVISAVVQLSFPPTETTPGIESQQKITAAVYIKHQGNLDDPNLQIESKVKRLVASSVSGLDINDVTVVTDRSRFTDVQLETTAQMVGNASKDYVKIWSMTMTRTSAATFRVLFFVLMVLLFALFVFLGWLFWKIYPILRSKGVKALFQKDPFNEPNLDNKEEDHAPTV